MKIGRSSHAWSGGATSLLALGLLLAVLPVQGQNRIQIENLLPGSTDWQLRDPAIRHEIEGYASLTSVNVGGTILLYVNTPSSSYSIDIFRMGWYGGAGGRLMHRVNALPGIQQPAPTSQPGTGMVECNWQDPFVLAIPSTWVSGVYLAKLTAFSGKQSYIIFVVREDGRPADYLFNTAVTTYQAYNNFGGKSLYGFNSSDGPSTKVSFNRPYAAGWQDAAATGVGAGEFLTHVQPPNFPFVPAWEFNFLRFMEREGYNVVYSTDVDLQERFNLPLAYKAFLSTGHDEYWSWEMRASIIGARDAGVNLAFMGSNAMYWQIRFEPSPVSGTPNRTVVCYKNADNDPVKDHRRTIRWRELGLPENSVIGIMYTKDPVAVDLVVTNTSHWAFEGTGLRDGEVIPGLVGYEVDRVYEGTPAGLVLLGHSPLDQSRAEWADMSIYTAPSGAFVFATGSMQFAWALDDDYHSPALRPSRANAGIQRMMRNILNRFRTNAPISVSVAPAAVTLNSGGSHQFTATVSGPTDKSVTWSMTPTVGTLSTTGLYTAPASIAQSQTISIRATSVADPSTAGTATVTLAPVAVSVSPLNATLGGGQTRQFVATVTGSTNTTVNWSLQAGSLGSITPAGLYSAPSPIASSATATVIATSVADPAKSASAVINLVPISVSIVPTAAALTASRTQQFTSTVTGSTNQSVAWTTSGPGSISTTGLYTAPASIPSGTSATVVATSAADASKSASAVVTLNPTTISISVAPSSVALTAGQSRTFTATVTGSPNRAVTWRIDPPGVGTITTAGRYTAPATVATSTTVRAIAASVADPSKTAFATITLRPAPPSCSTPSINSFTGCYYNDREFRSLGLMRNDPVIDFTWGTGPPAPGMRSDLFTARWLGSFNFTAGSYRFTLASDDGTLLYIDGNLVLNNWGEHGPTPVSTTINLTAGMHTIRVDYFEEGGGASARLTWVPVP